MNIGETFYCSHCMRKLSEEEICPYCGYDGNEEYSDKSLLPEGTLLRNGRYELGSVVGIGGFGITYAAWDFILQIPTAIKEYFPRAFAERNTDESDDVWIKKNQEPAFRLGYDKFLKEAHILGTLQNMKSVVTVRDWFEKNNTAYIAMEFIQGSTIDTYIKQHKVSSKQILDMLKPTIQELGQIHQLGILHRDISPSNLILGSDKMVKLIDFGSAIDIEQYGHKKSNTLLYNPDFAAPEQWDPNGQIGPWTDVYGISSVIYYLLTGETVPKGKRDTGELKLPQWQREVLFRGMLPSSEARIQTMAEFYARLYDTPLPEEIKKLETTRRKQRKVIVFGGIAAVIINLNCSYGLPLGAGYRYQLNYDGFHIQGVTDNWSGNRIPEKRLFIPVSYINVTALSIDSRGKFTVPGTIKAIERQAFYSCGFEYIEIEDGTEYIGKKAFASTKRLQGVYIPASVELIEDDAFEHNPESLVIWGERNSEAERYAKMKGITFATKDEFCYNRDSGSLEKYLGDDKNIVIPPTFLDQGYIYNMASDVFSECDGIKSVALPDMLYEVPSKLFKEYASIETVVMGDSTQTIQAEAFAKSGLTQVKFPEFLTSIGVKAFYQCKIRSVELPEKLLEIEASAFQGTLLNQIIIPPLVTSIKQDAFGDCADLNEVRILAPDCDIADSAFRHCPTDIRIYGFAGSTAETYAKEHDYTFVVIKEVD